MSKIIVLGASGALGKQVAQQALDAGHSVTALVRSPTKLPDNLRAHLEVVQADIATLPVHALSELFRTYDVVVNAAGFVTEGVVFTALVDHIIRSVEAIESAHRPVLWVVAGAAVLDLGTTGVRAVELPPIQGTYWPHAENLQRLQESLLDWRMLCPGPMVDGPALGLDHMRQSVDQSPLELPDTAHGLPADQLLPLVMQGMPEMIVSYADAAALVLAHLEPGGTASRRRFGLALPVGVRGSKDQWMAAPAQGVAA